MPRIGVRNRELNFHSPVCPWSSTYVHSSPKKSHGLQRRKFAVFRFGIIVPQTRGGLRSRRDRTSLRNGLRIRALTSNSTTRSAQLYFSDTVRISHVGSTSTPSRNWLALAQVLSEDFIESRKAEAEGRLPHFQGRGVSCSGLPATAHCLQDTGSIRSSAVSAGLTKKCNNGDGEYLAR